MRFDLRHPIPHDRHVLTVSRNDRAVLHSTGFRRDLVTHAVAGFGVGEHVVYRDM
jgi:hypothetical protein